MFVGRLCYVLHKGFICRRKVASLGTPAIRPTFEVQLKSSFLVHECTYHNNPYEMSRLFWCSDNVANNVKGVLELTSASSST